MNNSFEARLESCLKSVKLRLRARGGLEFVMFDYIIVGRGVGCSAEGDFCILNWWGVRGFLNIILSSELKCDNSTLTR